MTTIYTGHAKLVAKVQQAWKFIPAVVANDEQILIMNNHKCYGATTSVSLHVGMPPGSVAFATVWWCPTTEMTYARNMVQSSAMVSDKVVTLQITIPACDDMTHAADAQHGVLCLGFRAVATDSKTVPPVSVAIEATLTSCVGRVPLPGAYHMVIGKGLNVEEGALARWEV